jgi:hypothetical protein
MKKQSQFKDEIALNYALTFITFIFTRWFSVIYHFYYIKIRLTAVDSHFKSKKESIKINFLDSFFDLNLCDF